MGFSPAQPAKEPNSTYRETLTESVQRSSLFTARLYRSDFDVVLRKLISELQARS